MTERDSTVSGAGAGAGSDFALDPSLGASAVASFFEVVSESFHHFPDGRHIPLRRLIPRSSGFYKIFCGKCRELERAEWSFRASS